jgi:peptide/nickel transport system substrate-binding protein
MLMRCPSPFRLGALLLSICLGFSIGCGSSGESREDAVRGTYASFPDSLDPALSFTLEGAAVLRNSYIPLLTYSHSNGAGGTRLIPGLAAGLPKIDHGGRRFTLYLRPGLKYSNGRPVRASDFRFAVERLIRLNSVGSPFFMGIVGAERFARTKQGPIRGIAADDRTGKIVVRLREPSGTFSYVLGLPFGAPLPPETPIEDLTVDPPPATGPYLITAVRPGRSWECSRNPAWTDANGQAMPHLPDGHVDDFVFEVRANSTTQVEEIERGNADWMQNPPPPDLYAELKRRFGGTQFREQKMISVYYFWMNTQTPPFDDVRVRRAVNYAINPAALERIYAGYIRRTQQVLPSQMPGYQRFEPYPYDIRRAKRLIDQADPADREVTVWTNNLSPNDEAGAYYEQVLDQLGFETKLKAVNSSTYFNVISNAATPELDTGWTNWLLDFPHPDNYFGPQLSGARIAETGNTNWSFFDDPEINARIDRLSRHQLGPEQERAYAALDRMVMRRAPWAPFGTLTLGTFVSDRIDLDELIVNPIYGWDLTSFRVE